MQYDLTEEQRMLQDMVRRLAKEQVEPGAAKRDVDGKFDWEMVDLLRENGLISIDFPEAYGGSRSRHAGPGHHGGGTVPGGRGLRAGPGGAGTGGPPHHAGRQ